MTQALFYSSNAVAMTLAAGINSGDTTCSLSVATGLPASFPFKLLIGWGTGQQEVVHCTALSGTTATITRGQDTTTAQSHSIGASVVHGVSAREFNDLELHVAASSGVHGLSGAVVGTTDVQALSNKTLDAASTIGGVSGTSLAADRTAWTVDTSPNVANGTTWTLAAGSYQRYKQIGKTVIVELWAKCGANNTAGQFLWTLPVAPRDVTQQTLVLGSFSYFGAAYHVGVVTPTNSGSIVNFRVNGGTAPLGQGDGFFASNTDVLSAVLTYEAA